jgi:hypothetical protein
VLPVALPPTLSRSISRSYESRPSTTPALIVRSVVTNVKPRWIFTNALGPNQRGRPYYRQARVHRFDNGAPLALMQGDEICSVGSVGEEYTSRGPAALADWYYRANGNS